MKLILLTTFLLAVLGLVESFLQGRKGICTKQNCKFGGRCIFKYGKSRCTCRRRCSYGKSVCGSDGRTYRNICELFNARCKQQKRIKFVKFGRCNKHCPKDKIARCFVRPCQFAKCKAFPKATCLDNYCGGCKADFYFYGKKVDCKPVITTCASKKCRFDQKCEIVKGSAICRPQRPILTCAAVTCLAGTRCVIQNGVPRCLRACQHLVCPPFQNCTEVNGEAFCRGQNPVVSCAAVTCFRGLQCVIRNGQAFCKRPCKSHNDCRQGASCQSGFCECNRFCPAVVSLPVCGSDGKTYGSVCQMDVAACAKNVEIKSVLCSGKKISACVAKVCPLGTNCKEVNGKAECRRPTPTCAAVLCPVGTLCVIENGNAICKK